MLFIFNHNSLAEVSAYISYGSRLEKEYASALNHASPLTNLGLLADGVGERSVPTGGERGFRYLPT